MFCNKFFKINYFKINKKAERYTGKGLQQIKIF